MVVEKLSKDILLATRLVPPLHFMEITWESTLPCMLSQEYLRAFPRIQE